VTRADHGPRAIARRIVNDWTDAAFVGDLTETDRERLESLLEFWRTLIGLKLGARRQGRDPMGWLPFGEDPMLERPLALCRRFLDEIQQSGVTVKRRDIEQRIAGYYARLEAECPLIPRPATHLPPPRR
jgi:hypothetical protein